MRCYGADKNVAIQIKIWVRNLRNKNLQRQECCQKTTQKPKSGAKTVRFLIPNPYESFWDVNKLF